MHGWRDSGIEQPLHAWQAGKEEGSSSWQRARGHGLRETCLLREKHAMPPLNPPLLYPSSSLSLLLSPYILSSLSISSRKARIAGLQYLEQLAACWDRQWPSLMAGLWTWVGRKSVRILSSRGWGRHSQALLFFLRGMAWRQARVGQGSWGSVKQRDRKAGLFLPSLNLGQWPA